MNKLKCKALRYTSYVLLSETRKQEKYLLRRTILPCNISRTPTPWPDLELDHIDSHRNLGDDAICNVHFISKPHSGACSEMDTREYMTKNGLGGGLFIQPPRRVSEMIRIDSLGWWDCVSQPDQFKARLKCVQERFPEPFPIIASIYRNRNQARQTVLAFPTYQEPPKEAKEAKEAEEAEEAEEAGEAEETEVYESQADVELQEMVEDVAGPPGGEVVEAGREKPENACAHKLCSGIQTDDSRLCYAHSRCRRNKCKHTALWDINVAIRGAKLRGNGATCPKHETENRRKLSRKRQRIWKD